MSFIFDFVIAVVALALFVLFIDKNLRLRKVGAIIMWISYFAYIIYILQ
jgi:cation:H+ antiporter